MREYRRHTLELCDNNYRFGVRDYPVMLFSLKLISDIIDYLIMMNERNKGT